MKCHITVYVTHTVSALSLSWLTGAVVSDECSLHIVECVSTSLTQWLALMCRCLTDGRDCQSFWSSRLYTQWQWCWYFDIWVRHAHQIQGYTTLMICLFVPLLWDSMGEIMRSLASVCLSVIAHAVAILNQIWWNIARSFGVGKLRFSVRGQNPIMPLFYP